MRSVDERVLMAAAGMGASRLRVFWAGLHADDAQRCCRRNPAGLCLFYRVLHHPGASGWRPQRDDRGTDLSSHLPNPRLGAGRRDLGPVDGDRRRLSGDVDPPYRRVCQVIRIRPGLIATTLAALASVFLLMPLLAVIPVSFTPKRFLSVPKDEWSLRHYQSLIEKPEWGESVLLSIKVGIASSALATALALFFALGIWMMRPRFAGFMTGLALLPMVAPPVVSALTLYFFLNTMSKMNGFVGYDTWAGVAVAHAVMVVPYAVVIVMVALSQVDRKIDLAAKSMGASVTTRIFGVILPNIRFWRRFCILHVLRAVLGRNRRYAVCHVGQRRYPAPTDVDGPARQYRPGHRIAVRRPDCNRNPHYRSARDLAVEDQERLSWQALRSIWVSGMDRSLWGHTGGTAVPFRRLPGW